MKKLVVLTGLLFLVGCVGTAYKMNNLNLGMSKQEVIQVLGPPLSSSAIGNTEYLNYKLYIDGDHAFMNLPTDYFVRIINGRVESYGKMGDFDSTRGTEFKGTYDLNIRER